MRKELRLPPARHRQPKAGQDGCRSDASSNPFPLTRASYSGSRGGTMTPASSLSREIWPDQQPDGGLRRRKNMGVRSKPLDQQVIVITGGSSGIGLVTARMAAERGAKVVISSRNEQALREEADRLNAKRGNGGEPAV